MRLSALDPATRRAILEALTRVPEDVRRIALEQVSFVSTGRFSAGMALPPPVAEGGWLVIVSERGDAAVNTVGHELAHVVCGHTQGTVEAEHEATGLAALWGFSGDSVNGDVAARRFHESRPPVPRMRALIGDSVVRIECPCGTTCRVLAPTVGGMAAEVGVVCPACEWCEIVELRELVRCPACRERAAVTWTPDATPDFPVATWTCECGATTTLQLQRELAAEADPPPGPCVPDEVWPIAQAARRLLGVEESVRRMEAAVQAGEVPDALESCRSTLVWVRGLLSRAVRSLDPTDPRRLFLNDADGELANAGAELVQRNLAASADAVAHAASTLDAMLTPTGGGRD